MGIPRFNNEGYPDPTAHDALSRIPQTKRQASDPNYRAIVFVCSPFAGDIEQNVQNAIRFCQYTLSRNRFPFAPHLLFPRFLDDRVPEQRDMGLKYGRIFMKFCKEVWVFGSTFSRGMESEISIAKHWNKPVRFFTDEIREVSEYEARHRK